MIADAKAGKIDLIITKSVSRFARNIVDCVTIVRMLNAMRPPVGIFFETEHIFTLKDNSEMSLNFTATMAQEESHVKSSIMNASIEMRFSHGIVLTPVLLGYDHDDDGKLTINEEEAKIVRLIFFLYLFGYTCQEIADTLTEIGCETKRGNNVWNPGSILQILRNERYCGDVLTRKTFTPSYLDHKSRKNMTISHIQLESIEEAVSWVCKNQLLRKDLPERLRPYLIGKRFLAEKALGAHEAAKARRSAFPGMTTTVIVDNSPYDATATKTCERLGLEYHISFVTVRKYGIFASILDSIRAKEPVLAEKILDGKIKISYEHLVEISQLTPMEFTRMTRYFLNTTDHRPTYTKFRATLENSRKKEAVLVTPPLTGTIKDMPTYDPDGEVCSLALTIPSWISSIDRTQSVSDFDKVSESAGAKLIYELDRLVYAVQGIRSKLIKEVYHGRS